MADPLVGLTVIVPEAGDRPTTFRMRKLGFTRTLYAGLEADPAEAVQNVPYWPNTFLQGAAEVPSGEWFLFLGGTVARRLQTNVWESWDGSVRAPSGDLNKPLYPSVPRLMRGGMDMVALSRHNEHLIVPYDPAHPSRTVYDLVAMTWRFTGSVYGDNVGGNDVAISVLAADLIRDPDLIATPYEVSIPGAIWQDPTGRDVVFYPEGDIRHSNSALLPAYFYIRTGDIYGDAWDAPVRVVTPNEGNFGATMGYRGSSYQALPLEPDRSVLVAYVMTDEPEVGYPPENLWIWTRLLTWTGLTYTLGPDVTAVGPFSVAGSADYLMIGGMWQRNSGEVCLFFGEHISGALHLLTSTDRGTSWH